MSPMDVRHISSKTVPTTSHSDPTTHPQIHLNAWDLQFLKVHAIQKGLLYQLSTTTTTITSLIDRLETSLSLTLNHFFPLAGRLATTTHQEDNKISVHIDCNNAGAELIHATAPSVTVADIINPVFVPRIVHDFFPLNGTLNYDHKNPLIAVQVTELVDGIFIGITMNHLVVDGTSFWHFVNTWSEISRTGSDHSISTNPSLLHRWFPNNETDNLRPPIRFRFDSNEEQHELINPPLPLEERVFHFSAESIARLKAKANSEQPKTLNGPIKISSLQAVLAHIWLGVTRARHLGYNEETTYCVLIGNRARLVPPLPKEYFGCAVSAGMVVAKAGELLEQGLGWAATRLNQEIAAYDDAALRSSWESWVKKPVWPSLADFSSKLVLFTGSSPRFNVYGNDFGWGRPIAVRSGVGNKVDGKITVFEGNVEGSMDFEACLSPETLKAMGDDAEFMEEVSDFLVNK